MDNQQPSISEFELGWLCGVIDGEGCIGLWSRGGSRSHEYKPGMRIANTSKPLVDKVCALLKSIDVGCHVTYYKPRNERSKEYWAITVEGFKRLNKLLPVIKDILVEKKAQAALLWAWCESRQSKWKSLEYSEFELDIPKQLSALNYRGLRE